MLAQSRFLWAAAICKAVLPVLVGKKIIPQTGMDKRTHCPQQGYLRTTDVAATEKQVLLCLLCSSLALWQPVLTPMFLAGLLAGINSI